MHAYQHIIPLHPTSGVLCTASDSYTSILYPHHHAACELSLILSGIHVVELEDQIIEFTSGGLLLLRPDEPHSRRMISPGRYLTLAFPVCELERLDAYLDSGLLHAALGSKYPQCAQLHDDEAAAVARSIERINLYCTADPKRVSMELRALLVNCWCRYLTNPEGDDPGRVPWLNRLLRDMERPENIRRGLGAMLEMTPYTHEYLCREFRRLMGCTPTEYVNSLRLDMAHRLLETTRLSVADICFDVGFDSVSYFHKLFRSKYGAPPARYRKLRFISTPDAPCEQRPDE